jgi:Flp pilus assembly protein TadD
MSVLIEALRNAEAARPKTAQAHRGEAPVATSVPPRDASTGRRRWVAFALAAAVVVLAAAWLWLQIEVAGTPAPSGVELHKPAVLPSTLADSTPDASAGTNAQLPGPAAAPVAPPTAPPAKPPVQQAPRVAAAPTAGATDAQAPGPRAGPASPAAAVVQRDPDADLDTAYGALRAGRMHEAQHLYRRLAETYPYNADVLFGLAAVAEARGDRANAIAGYRRVLQADPEHADALAALAELTAGQDPAPQASVLRVALARRPEAPSLHAALGRLLAAEGRWSEARQAFGSAAALAPDRAEYAFNLAVALDHLGQEEAARAAYLRAAELAATDPRPGIDAPAARARAQALADERAPVAAKR